MRRKHFSPTKRNENSKEIFKNFFTCLGLIFYATTFRPSLINDLSPAMQGCRANFFLYSPLLMEPEPQSKPL